MKPFNPEKDTLLISSDKKPVYHRDEMMHLRVERYKVAGPVHVVMWVRKLPLTGSMTVLRVERDQSRAAALKRVKDWIDQKLDEDTAVVSTQHGEFLVKPGADTLAQVQEMGEAVTAMNHDALSDDERAGYMEGRF